MYSKKNGRVTFRSNRRQPYKKYSNFSNGKMKNRGNISQQYQKFLKLAKEAASGDRIQAEYYYQFADHYFRTMVELGIVVEENDNSQQDMPQLGSNQSDKEEDKGTDTNEVSLNNDSKNESEIVQENDDHESIESVPFISEPVKKKTTKSKKEVS
mgnify:CR=1 FL=1